MVLRFEAYDPRPFGGQVVGVSAAVKCIHEETGLFAVSGTEGSQHKNRAIAQAMVEYGLAEIGWKESL